MVHRIDETALLVGRTWLSWAAVAVGLALVGYGFATHLSFAGGVHCRDCAPFHPLLVLAPVTGGLLAVAAGMAVAPR